MNILITIILTALVLSLVDYIYLSIIGDYFNKMITKIQGVELKLKFVSVLLCYFTLVFGIYYFIIRRNETVLNAMILGWVIYLVYELTNKSIIKHWSWIAVIIDGLWGGILFGLTTIIMYNIIGKKIVLY